MKKKSYYTDLVYLSEVSDPADSCQSQAVLTLTCSLRGEKTWENIMRVIAGSARRIQLKTIGGLDTRPTTDRIKETLFNMIQNRLMQSCFLDCFSGSGAIGIEALSRGASKAVFIEQNPRAVECIRQNLKATHLEEKAQVLTCDVLTGLKRLEDTNTCFDIIFMDPPYDMEWEKKVLAYLKDSGIADQETLIIAEASLKTDFSCAEHMGYMVEKNKEYKTNKHVFLRKDFRA